MNNILFVAWYEYGKSELDEADARLVGVELPEIIARLTDYLGG